MTVRLGSLVSHYRLVRRLGAGGMGEVFLAEDTRLDRQVAIKFLIAPSEDASRRRLLHEARAVAALEHPASCAIYEVGTDPDGGDFIVMQFVDGESLATRLQRGPLSPTVALTMVAAVADALAVAHRRGIVHRDLKPQNIMLTRGGTPKLLDFGLAKRVATTMAAAEALTTSQVTQPYAIVGTPGYMAPEQIRNEAPDFRSDLFALGAVLYECLTGRRAFEGRTPPDVLAQVLQHRPPPPSTLAPALGAAHDALCARLLDKDPDQRFQSAEAVATAIAALAPLPLTPTPAAPASHSPVATWRAFQPKRRRQMMVGIVAALALTIFAMLWVQRSRDDSLAPPEALEWYRRGVEAVRDGTYARAKEALLQAVRLHAAFPQAHSRLAEAYSELDDDQNAQRALLRVGSLVPNRDRLGSDAALRLRAVEATVLRDHPVAIESYRALANARPDDADGWLDLGRAEEAAGLLLQAETHYALAVSRNSQLAAAQLRLGALENLLGHRDRALALLDEAARLYRAATNVEGEAEALLRRGTVLLQRAEYAEARRALERVMALAADPLYLYQRLRAQLDLAQVTYAGGNLSRAAELARDAGDEAMRANLMTLVATSKIVRANFLEALNDPAGADAQLDDAIALAERQNAKRTEMRARLTKASHRLGRGDPAQALELAQAPLKFFADRRYVRNEIEGTNVEARAFEQLERYEEARAKAARALELAGSIEDVSLKAVALENVAGQLANLGRLPEALQRREEIEAVHRQQGDVTMLSFDLPNRAELLIGLGRATEAEALLAEVRSRSDAGVEAYAKRRSQVAVLRTLLAATRGELRATIEHARGIDPANTDHQAVVAVLTEFARTHAGQSRLPVAEIRAGLDAVRSPVRRRELGYWVARMLLDRRDYAAAYAIARESLTAPGAAGNVELRWRVAAVGALAATLGTFPDDAKMRAAAETDRRQLASSWGDAATPYFARPDLAELHKKFVTVTSR